MTKTLTEQFMDGSFECNVYYCQTKYDGLKLLLLYHDGCEHGYAQKFGECEDYPHKDIIEVLTPVPSYDKYEQLVSNSDELVQKVHILNEQNTKQYNELCEEIKKNNRLEKQLDIAFKILHKFAFDYDDTTKPSVFIENSLIALGDMREVK